jgi:cytochrome c oxidase assembly protein Cox11
LYVFWNISACTSAANSTGKSAGTSVPQVNPQEMDLYFKKSRAFHCIADTTFKNTEIIHNKLLVLYNLVIIIGTTFKNTEISIECLH